MLRAGCIPVKVYPRARGGAWVKVHASPHTVYPRARGGAWLTSALPGTIPQHCGLSPRTRGSQDIVGRHRETLPGGSIPAHAGEPVRKVGGFLESRRVRVYPRARGGARVEPLDAVMSSRRRSIPAHAGEPESSQSRRSLVIGGSIPAHAGEPVAPVSDLQPKGFSGSIPAHAGEPR